MLVNGIDIATYKAKLLNKSIDTADVTIYNDWLKQSISPIYFGKKVTYKTVKCNFIIEDSTDDLCITDISNFMTQLSKCIIKFDDISYYYDCVISSKESFRLLKEGYFSLSVEFKSSYAYLPEVTLNTSGTSQTLSINGNMETPAIVKLTSSVGLASVIITGFGKSMTIKNVTANTPITINGESCLVTEGSANKFADTDMWGFPVLRPGSNPITINQSGVTLEIKYKPKFM